MFFLATISTVTVVSNWSFRSFRNRFNQHEYAAPPPTFSRPPSGQHHPPMPSSQYPFQHNPGLPYGDHAQGHIPNLDNKSEVPLMLEHPQMDFVTERTRDRENHMRTPSPVKRNRHFS
jgi:hypothetical protein